LRPPWLAAYVAALDQEQIARVPESIGDLE
jgi:hypothetical protein